MALIPQGAVTNPLAGRTATVVYCILGLAIICHGTCLCHRNHNCCRPSVHPACDDEILVIAFSGFLMRMLPSNLCGSMIPQLSTVSERNNMHWAARVV
eukprot:5271106-Amphidinium_carterae.1